MIQNKKNQTNLVWIGTIVNTHSLKGEVRVLTNSDEIEVTFALNSKIFYKFNGDFKELIIDSYRPHKKFLLLKFKNFNSINDVEFLKNHKIYGLKKQLEEKENEFYYSDLIDYTILENGLEVGKIISYFDQNAYYSFEVKLKNGKITNIPILENIIKKINHKDKNVIISYLNNDY